MQFKKYSPNGNTIEQRQFFQQSVPEQLDIHMQKNDQTQTLQPSKNEPKMDQRPKCKTEKHKTLENSIGKNVGDFKYGDNLLDTTPKA